jgi:hypothetical protein
LGQECTRLLIAYDALFVSEIQGLGAPIGRTEECDTTSRIKSGR